MGSALEQTQVQILQAIKSKSLKLQQVSPDYNELVPFYKDDIWVIGNISGLLPGDLFQVINGDSISLYWKSTGQLFSKGFYYEYLDKNDIPYDSLESYKIATNDFFVKALPGGGGISIGVIGTDLYASVQPSTLVDGAYQLTSIPDNNETEITMISSNGIEVNGNMYISEVPAVPISLGQVGFDYWRKVSSIAGDSFTGVRFFLYDTADESFQDIFTLWSPSIEVTEFEERQISYSIQSVIPTATQYYGVEFLFRATGSPKTFTMIIGDGRGWYVRLPIPFDHDKLSNKNSNIEFQHIDESINEIPAAIGAANYTLLNRKQNLITGTLPNGVSSTLILPTIVEGRNEVIVHFKTNAIAPPTLIYSGFTPVWLNGTPISMKVNKQYTIVFEQINGIVKTSWGEY